MEEQAFRAAVSFDRESESFWWKNAVFYEVYVDKFAGNFKTFARRLDYLKLLGITCIHLLPYYPSPMVDDGYDITDYRSIRPELGTLDGFAHFVREAHERGIRVLVDLVLNHVSVKHPWFAEASSSRANPKRGYFLWSDTGTELARSVNSFPDIKPSNWIPNPSTDDYYYSTFYPEQADLNWDNPQIFREMTSIIDFWADLGVDGFRLDASSHLIKREETTSEGLPETHVILKRLRTYLDTRHAGTILLAEVHNPLEKMKEYFGDGDECHLVYNFPLVEAIFLALLRGEMSSIERALMESKDIPVNCGWATFIRHHDEMSLATLSETDRTELFERFDPNRKHRFSTGISERLATMFRGDTVKILEAFRVLLYLPGSPIIYYGDEIGMKNGALATGEKDTRKALREKFDWNEALAELKAPSSLFKSIASLIRGRKLSEKVMDEITKEARAA